MYKYEEDEAKDRIAEFIAKEFEAASKNDVTPKS